MEKDESELNLTEDLKVRIDACRSKAKMNDGLAYGLILVSVISSSLATIAVGTDLFTKEIRTILTALPGIIVVILNTFKYEARARWWWKKYSMFKSFLNEIRLEGADEKGISKKLNKFLILHEGEWPSFGKPPSGMILNEK